MIEWHKTNWPGMWQAYLSGYRLEIVTVRDDEDDGSHLYHCRIWKTVGGDKVKDPRDEVVKQVIHFHANMKSLTSAQAELESKVTNF